MEDSYKHKGMRKSLLKILKEKGIKDKAVLEAIYKVPRHYFFENAFLEHAYQDKAFPIGEGQTISQPYTVAFQTQLLQLKPGEKVLEVGTGSGYQCCILMEMGARVTTMEYNETLQKKAKAMLPKMGYNPAFILGDGSNGYAANAPYHKILVTAAAPFVPGTLVKQLHPGGTLVIPVGGQKLQKMLRVIKTFDNSLIKEEFDNFSFVPLRGEHGWKESE